MDAYLTLHKYTNIFFYFINSSIETLNPLAIFLYNYCSMEIKFARRGRANKDISQLVERAGF